MKTFFVVISANVWGWIEAETPVAALRAMAIRHKLIGRVTGKVRESDARPIFAA